MLRKSAEGVGFEPTEALRLQRFSRPPHSTALPPLRTDKHRALDTICGPPEIRLTPKLVRALTQAAMGSGWHDDHIERARVDVWLWAVRIYKTRSAATAACRGGHVRVNRAAVKASSHVKVGDRVEAFVERERILEVAVVIDKRVGAAVAATCLVDHSPPAPVVRRQPPMFIRERGTGRPTKRERRELDRLRRP